MQNLINFFIKYHFFILFLFLEIIAFSLIVQRNNYQKANFINSANSITGGIYQSYSSVTDFFSLKEENEKLAAENAYLKNQLVEKYFIEIPTLYNDTIFNYDTLVIDSTRYFDYISAKVINNSINKQYNIIYLNKGSLQGVNENMGVIGINGLIGVVVSTSKNFSTVLPLLNKDLNINVRIKRLGYFGNLSWNGKDVQYAHISEMPNHIVPMKGDTVVSSGNSNIFPENILVGYVEETTGDDGSGFSKIKVRLSVDFGNLDYVYVIKNNNIEELKTLEN